MIKSFRVKPRHLPETLSQLRRNSKLKQYEVADLLGMKTHASIHNYEAGRVSPTIARLDELAYVLGYDIEIRFIERDGVVGG